MKVITFVFNSCFPSLLKPFKFCVVLEPKRHFEKCIWSNEKLAERGVFKKPFWFCKLGYKLVLHTNDNGVVAFK